MLSAKCITEAAHKTDVSRVIKSIAIAEILETATLYLKNICNRICITE